MSFSRKQIEVFLRYQAEWYSPIGCRICHCIYHQYPSVLDRKAQDDSVNGDKATEEKDAAGN